MKYVLRLGAMVLLLAGWLSSKQEQAHMESICVQSCPAMGQQEGMCCGNYGEDYYSSGGCVPQAVEIRSGDPVGAPGYAARRSVVSIIA